MFVRKRRARLLLPLACLLLGAAASDAARAETLLRWKFKAGDQARYTMVMDTAQEMKSGDMAAQTKMNQRMEFVWSIKEVAADGTATMTQTIERIQADMTLPQGAPGGAIKYDSDQEDAKREGPAEMLAGVYDALVGHAFTMKISPRGEISDIQLPAEFLEAIKKSPLQQMGGMFSEDGLKQMIGRGIAPMPEGGVSKGATWDSTMTTTNPAFGKQVADTQYTYQGSERRGGEELEKIGVAMQIRFEKGPGAQVDLEVKDQETGGVLYFDNARGSLVESQVTSKMTLELTFGGMTLDQVITTNVTMKLAPPSTAREL